MPKATSKSSKAPAKKKNHALRKLVGAVMVAGAVYAAEKLVQSRRKSKAAPKKSDSDQA